MSRANTCKDCKPPKRHPGCHVECKEYKAWKAEHEERKQKIKDEQNKQRMFDETQQERVERIYLWRKKHKR